MMDDAKNVHRHIRPYGRIMLIHLYGPFPYAFHHKKKKPSISLSFFFISI